MKKFDTTKGGKICKSYEQASKNVIKINLKKYIYIFLALKIIKYKNNSRKIEKNR